MDDSTLATRKDAANRDKQYDVRQPVNHQISERNCTCGFSHEYIWLGIIYHSFISSTLVCLHTSVVEGYRASIVSATTVLAECMTLLVNV